MPMNLEVQMYYSHFRLGWGLRICQLAKTSAWAEVTTGTWVSPDARMLMFLLIACSWVVARSVTELCSSPSCIPK